MNRRLTLWIFLGLTTFGSCITYAQANTEVQWISFEQLHDSLKVHPKKVFIDFYAAWCSPCLKMDEVAFKDPKVVQCTKFPFCYPAEKMPPLPCPQ